MKALLFHLPRIWDVEERVVGADLGFGRFQFDFQNEEDITEVLKKGPFHFDNWMLAIVRWEPVVEVNYPSKITFWVRVIGVPLHFWAEPTFKGIGGALGEVRGDDDVDIHEGRVRVILDAFKPLIFSVTVEFHSGEETVIALRYEKLHGFCRTCSSLRHDQSKCPTTKGDFDEGGEGPSDKLDNDDKALSYKGAVESQVRENISNENSRSHNQQPEGKHDYKGKGIAFEGGKQAVLAKGGPRGRRYRDQGRPPVRQGRQEFSGTYAMDTRGVNRLHYQEVGSHLDSQQKLMMDAFKSAGNTNVPGSKIRKALLFEEEEIVVMEQVNEEVKHTEEFNGQKENVETNEAVDKLGSEALHDVEISTSMEVEMKLCKSTADQGDRTSEETLGVEEEVMKEIKEKEDSGMGTVQELSERSVENEEIELVQGFELDSAQAEAFDAEMMLEDAKVVEEANQSLEIVETVEEKKRQPAKKKTLKVNANAMVGNTKKRLVQSLISPRKKVMAKGEKGPIPTKKTLVKPHPDQD